MISTGARNPRGATLIYNLYVGYDYSVVVSHINTIVPIKNQATAKHITNKRKVDGVFREMYQILRIVQFL